LEVLSKFVLADSKIVVRYEVHYLFVIFVLICNYNGIAFIGLKMVLYKPKHAANKTDVLTFYSDRYKPFYCTNQDRDFGLS
jgi:hypothetical protein